MTEKNLPEKSSPEKNLVPEEGAEGNLSEEDVATAEAFVRACIQDGSFDFLKGMMEMAAESSGEEDEEGEDPVTTALEAEGDGPALWSSAENMEHLCELSARWIEGRLKYRLGYGGESLDAETEPLVPVLAALNRAGFFTDNSQPGEAGTGFRQRAYVSGLALEPVARRIAKLGLCTDLIAVVKRPGEESGYIAPVTVDNFQPFTWAVTGEAALMIGAIGGKSNEFLLEAWSVIVFDPVWGRQEYLWDHLARELCYDVTPADYVLDTDFIA